MKVFKKVMVGIMATVMACGALMGAGCAKEEEKTNDKNQVNAPSVETPAPIEPDYDGQIVRTGGSYAFSEKIAFLGSDVMPMSDVGETASYTPVTVTLTATVTPADANQAVDWEVEFVNGESAWASGKTVTDYVSITTETDGSTTATVTCSAPFGEQIEIVCISQDNPEITASCTVDFIQAVENVSLTFGNDLPINLGGQTDIVWEINESGVGKGGQANVVIDTSDVYTVARSYSWDIDLVAPEGVETDNTGLGGDWGENWGSNSNPAYEDGKLRLANYDCYISKLNNITTLCFDYAFLDTSEISFYGTIMMLANCYKFTDMSVSQSKRIELFSNIQEGSLYTLELNIKEESSSNVVKSYKSQLVLTGYTNTSNVQSISLSSSTLNF